MAGALYALDSSQNPQVQATAFERLERAFSKEAQPMSVVVQLTFALEPRGSVRVRLRAASPSSLPVAKRPHFTVVFEDAVDVAERLSHPQPR